MTSELSDYGPTLRLIALLMSSVTTVLYVLVGFEVVKVDGVAEVEPGPALPLVLAAVAFAALTAALALRPRPLVYVAGIVLSVVVVVGYFVVAPSRHPSFEAWGLSIKAVELVLLAALVGLAIRRRVEQPETVRRATDPAPEPAMRVGAVR